MTAPARMAPRSLKILEDVAAFNSPRGGVIGMNPHRFPALNFTCEANGPVVHLAVQPRARLVRDQVQRKFLRQFASQPFYGFEPGGVGRAVGVPEALDALGVYLDFSGRRLERIFLRVFPEIGQIDVRRFRRGDFSVSGLPEMLEGVENHALGSRFLARLLVNVPEPFHLVAVFGECTLEPEALGQVGENIEIMPGVAHRLDHLVHGEDEAISRTRTDVVALKRCGGGQHDVRMARRGGPPGVVDDDGFRPLPRLHQPIQVLMVMERVAPAPVDHADVRVGAAFAVEVIFLARVEHHVRYAGDGDEAARRVFPGLHVGR